MKPLKQLLDAFKIRMCVVLFLLSVMKKFLLGINMVLIVGSTFRSHMNLHWGARRNVIKALPTVTNCSC